MRESKEPVATAEKEKDGAGGGSGRDDGFDECPDLTPEQLKNVVAGGS